MEKPNRTMAHNNISGHQQAPKPLWGRDAGVEQNISFPQRLQDLREKQSLVYAPWLNYVD